MGCDIHCYIEYQPSDQRWDSFGGRINPGRNYHLFGLLAGVRGNSDPVVPLRGMPTDAAYYARGDNQLYVKDKGDDASEGCCSKADAERWVASGSSRYTDQTKNWVTHPDWHSHTYLFTEEWERAISSVELGGCEYRAILAALKHFESEGYRARVVFWFDN